MDNPLTNISGQTEELTWTVHPLKKDPKKSVLFFLLIILTLIAVYGCFRDPIFVVLAFIFLAGSLKDFFFPTHYRLDREGVHVKKAGGTIARGWSSIRKLYPDKNGVFLSPFPEKSVLENYRGVYIMFDNNRDPVLEFIKKRMLQSPAPGS